MKQKQALAHVEPSPKTIAVIEIGGDNLSEM